MNIKNYSYVICFQSLCRLFYINILANSFFHIVLWFRERKRTKERYKEIREKLSREKIVYLLFFTKWKILFLIRQNLSLFLRLVVTMNRFNNINNIYSVLFREPKGHTWGLLREPKGIIWDCQIIRLRLFGAKDGQK